MQSTVGIYSSDYLLLLELTYLLENEMPDVRVELFGSKEFLDGLPAETLEQISEDPSGLLATDVAVILSPLPGLADFPAKYDGTILDMSGAGGYSYDDTILLTDPLFALLTEIAAINSDIAITAGLPVAVYGRAGVDQLMQETRSIYSFENYEDGALPMRLAFNIHFYPEKLPGGILADSVENLRKYAPVSLRINPVSTAFIVDIAGCRPLELPENLETFTPGEDFSLEDITSGSAIALLTASDGRLATLIGDYLHLKTATLLRAVKAALGL